MLCCSDEAVCFPVLMKEIVDEQGHWHEKAKVRMGGADQVLSSRHISPNPFTEC